MKTRRTIQLLLSAVLYLMLLFDFSSCAKRMSGPPGLEEVDGPPLRQTEQNPGGIEPSRILEEDVPIGEESLSANQYNRKMRALEDIYFDFDQFNIKSQSREILKKNFEILESRQPSRILIEGHCDENGTAEYNLALGQRRSKATRDYLVGLGLNPDQVEIMSFGEEKPLDHRHLEEAWEKNRRAHIMIVEK